MLVYAEQTGKREDNDIRKYHRSIIESGMFFDKSRSEKYTPLSGGDFARVLMKNPKFVTKDNVAAQIADLVLYPVAKGKYTPDYPPYLKLKEAGKLIDSVLSEKDAQVMGIKYYCFDNFGLEAHKQKGFGDPKPLPAVCDDARSHLTMN